MFLQAAFLLVACLNTVVKAQSSLCDCDLSKSWNDIMILADMSSTMGASRFSQVKAVIQSALSDATIGNQPFQTQVGVVSYSDKANLIAPLDKYKNHNDFDHDSWGELGAEDTNIMAGFEAARQQLESSGGRQRQNSRKVIITGAGPYKKGNYSFPQDEALKFKNDFGVIIVVGFDASDEIKAMASDGMFLDASQFLDSNSLTKLICNANCFCPGHRLEKDARYFPIVNNNESWPSLGCYWISGWGAIQQLVNRTCVQLPAAFGLIAMPDTLKKQQGLLSGAPANLSKPVIYIGLQKSSAGQWLWGDGRPYQGNELSGDGDCAVVQQTNGFTTEITAVSCVTYYLYSCQTKPCTTTFYCED